MLTSWATVVAERLGSERNEAPTLGEAPATGDVALDDAGRKVHEESGVEARIVAVLRDALRLRGTSLN